MPHAHGINCMCSTECCSCARQLLSSQRQQVRPDRSNSHGGAQLGLSNLPRHRYTAQLMQQIWGLGGCLSGCVLKFLVLLLCLTKKLVQVKDVCLAEYLMDAQPCLLAGV